MKIQFLVEGAVFLIGLAFILTQVIIPGMRMKPMFPFLRKAPREADRKLTEAYESRDVFETLKQAEVVGKFEGVAPPVETPAPAPTSKKRGKRT